MTDQGNRNLESYHVNSRNKRRVFLPRYVNVDEAKKVIQLSRDIQRELNSDNYINSLGALFLCQQRKN